MPTTIRDSGEPPPQGPIEPLLVLIWIGVPLLWLSLLAFLGWWVFFMPAEAQSGSITMPSTSMTRWVQPPTYTFEPKDDITALELSKALVAILPALACMNSLSPRCGDQASAIDALPPEVKRHFVMHGESQK